MLSHVCRKLSLKIAIGLGKVCSPTGALGIVCYDAVLNFVVCVVVDAIGEEEDLAGD